MRTHSFISKLRMIVVGCLLLAGVSVSAMAAEAIGFVDIKNPQEGQTIKVNFTITADAVIDEARISVYYSPSTLEYLGTSSNMENMSDSVSGKLITIAGYGSNEDYIDLNLEFKVIESGYAMVELETNALYDENYVLLGSPESSINLYIPSESENISAECRLSGITMPDGIVMEPDFLADRLYYRCQVPFEMETFTCEPVVADSLATVKYDSALPLEVGVNLMEIVVTAENNDSMIYTLEIERLPDETQPDQIPLTIGGKEYILARKITMQIPVGYVSGEGLCFRENIQVAGKGSVILVQMEENGKEGLYLYRGDMETPVAYHGAMIDGQEFTLMPFKGTLPSDYRDAVMNIEGTEYAAKQTDREGMNESAMYVICAMNNATGDIGMYLYNTETERLAPLTDDQLEEAASVDAPEESLIQEQEHQGKNIALIGAGIVISVVVLGIVAVTAVRGAKKWD